MDIIILSLFELFCIRLRDGRIDGFETTLLRIVYCYFHLFYLLTLPYITSPNRPTLINQGVGVSLILAQRERRTGTPANLSISGT